MSSFIIADFRLGIDRRKHILTAPPGSLYTGKNCNINRGGEIEAAKAFVDTFDLPAGTFGFVAAGGQLYVFGNIAPPVMPPGVLYVRLQLSGDPAMTEMVWTDVVKGKVFAIAAFAGGKIGMFYDNVLISDWATGAVGGTLASNSDVASHFAAIINTDPNYSAVSAGAVLTVTGLLGAAFTVATSAVNGGSTNDQTAVSALVQAAVAVVVEALSHGSITIAGGVAGNMLTSLKVNSVEVLGVAITHPGTDAGMASLIASQINSFVSTPNYTASVAGGIVTISAVAGTGAGPNGFVLSKTGSIGGSASLVNMSGGVTAVAGLPQISTVTIGGTFEAADIFTVTLGGIDFGGVAGTVGEQGTVALVHRSKTYVIAGPNLFGSAIDDPTEWDGGTGSFVIDMSTQAAGAERLTALGIFQNNLAVFSRSATQIWSVDADPANNAQLQVLDNIGALAPKTVHAFGDADLFFLSDTGLRSLKVRVNTNSATLSDIGSPIDPLIIAAIAGAGGAASKAAGAIEPIDGRYLLQIGNITYAFSYFPAAKVSGWSTWEHGLPITDFAVVAQRLYARAGDKIYLLGGPANTDYSVQPLDVKLPFLSERQIDTLKHFTSLDVACDGTFNIRIATDPNSPDEEEDVGTVTQSTYGLGSFPINGEDTNVLSLHFVGEPSQYARIANITLRFEPLPVAA